MLVRALSIALLLATVSFATAGRGSAADFSVCGATVKANLDEGSTPKEFQRYLGLWTGNWNNGRICAGLIVKKIDNNGDAYIDYAYRPTSQSANITSQPAIAHVENKETLTFNDKDGSRYTFKLRPDSEIAATFLSTGGTRLETNFRNAAKADAPPPSSVQSAQRASADQEIIRGFLNTLFKRGGIAAVADSALGALFRRNDEINRRSGDKPMSAEANACECEISQEAKYSIRNIDVSADKATATYDATYGGVTKKITLSLTREDGSWRVHDLSTTGFDSLFLGIQKTNGELERLAKEQMSTIKGTTQQPSTNVPSGTRPDASDCFMGECFKQFIVSKRFEGQTTIAEIRTERYNVPTGSPQSPPPPPTTEKFVAACGSPGYIQRPGGERLKQPEPDPPHSTRAAKQLWEAICGSQVAPKGGEPSAPTQTGLPPGAQVQVHLYCHAGSKFDGYATEFRVKVTSLIPFRSQMAIVSALNEGMKQAIEHCKTDPNTIRDRHPDESSRFVGKIGIEGSPEAISAMKELGSNQWQINTSHLEEVIVQQQQQIARQQSLQEEFEREQTRTQQEAAKPPPPPPPPPPSPSLNSDDPLAVMLAKEAQGTIYFQFRLGANSQFCNYPRGNSVQPNFVFVGFGQQRIGSTLISAIVDQLPNLREDVVVIRATNAVLMSRKNSGLWGGGIEDCYQVDLLKCDKCTKLANNEVRIPFGRIDLTSVEFVNEFEVIGLVGPTRGKSYHVEYKLTKLVPSSQPLGPVDAAFKLWRSTCILVHNVVENEWHLQKC